MRSNMAHNRAEMAAHHHRGRRREEQGRYAVLSRRSFLKGTIGAGVVLAAPDQAAAQGAAA